MNSSRGYDGIALVAPVSFGYAKTGERSASWYIGSVLREMIAFAGIRKQDVDGLAVSSFSLAPDSVSFLTQHFGLGVRWLEQLPFGGASGVLALRRAARAVQAGDADIVACIGGDNAPRGGFGELVANFSSFSNRAAWPYGAGGPNVPFALITRHYMNRFGATREDFGRLAVSQRHNANHFEGALLGHKPLSLRQYLDARPVVEPLHLFDCVMPCAGGEGFLVMSAARARSLGLPHVAVLSAAEAHNAFAADAVQVRGGWDTFRDSLYQMAGVGPDDIDILETYDDYPVISMLQMEGLGFCAAGEAPAFIAARKLTFDGGDLAHNTSGGMLSTGQAGAAAGYLGLVEAMRQLTDAAVDNAVAGADVALVSGYGMVNYDRGLCTAAAILARAKA